MIMKRLTKKDGCGGWYINDQSVAFDERRYGEEIDRLAAYEGTGLEPDEIADVQECLQPIPFGRFHDIMNAERDGRLEVPLPNDPLSREQLMQMDGEPVFCVDKLNPDNNSYGIVCAPPYYPYVKAIRGWGYKINHFEFGSNDTYGLTWLAYRRKPEEENNETN